MTNYTVSNIELKHNKTKNKSFDDCEKQSHVFRERNQSQVFMWFDFL